LGAVLSLGRLLFNRRQCQSFEKMKDDGSVTGPSKQERGLGGFMP
jgi:hypothetical protein